LQFNVANIGKIDLLTSFSSSLPCAAEDLTSEFCLYIASFHRREDDLKNELKNTKEKVRSLEVNLREVEAGAEELKRVMKETIDSEYAISQNLAYEK
jgi:16S rRNA C1402 N4-methylase RsmH